MAYAIMMLSTGLQFAAAFVAIHISRRIRSWPFWLLAPAVLLMGVRRAFLLYRHWTFERSIDLGPEIIALSISVLMLAGLIGLYQWVALNGSGADPGQSPPGGGGCGRTRPAKTGHFIAWLGNARQRRHGLFGISCQS